MVKVEIYKDERWPDYGLSIIRNSPHPSQTVIEISDDELVEYNRANEIYDEMQKRLIEWQKRV